MLGRAAAHRALCVYLALVESPRRARDSACRARSRVLSHVQGLSGVGSCPRHYIDVCVHFRRVWSDLNDVDTFGPALSAACLISPLSARNTVKVG